MATRDIFAVKCWLRHSNVTVTEKDAKRLFPKNLWNKLHLQIIYYAREYSPSRGWNIENDIITKKIGRKSLLE